MRKTYDEKAEQHRVVAKLTELAAELGHTPSLVDMVSRVEGITEHTIKKLGGMRTLIELSGLEPERNQKKKKDIFNVPDASAFVSQHVPIEKRKRRENPWPKIMVISDIHWPFCHRPTIEKFMTFVGKMRPDFVVLNGDAWDFYSHSKFPRSHNVFTPKEEERLAREMNETFWKDVKRLSPKSTCYQILGNHDIRPMKRALESVPAMEHWVEKYFQELFTFDGVETIFDTRKELVLGEDIAIIHGYASRLGEHRDSLHMNAIVGHTHRPGVVYKAIGPNQEPLWEANSGLAGDPTAKGLTYTNTKMNGWVNSFLVVDEHGPRVIHT